MGFYINLAIIKNMKITNLDKKIFMPIIYLIVAAILINISIKYALNSHYDYKLNSCIQTLTIAAEDTSLMPTKIEIRYECIQKINGS